MKYDKKTIGKRIKYACKGEKTENEKLTQEALAEKLHYKRETVNSWANGRDLPPLDVLLKMCDIFGCELGYLLGEHEEPTRSATDIVKETRLSGDAVLKLEQYRHEAEKSPVSFIGEGTLALTNVITRYDVPQYFREQDFVPALVSYMITSPDFRNLVNRICSQNICMMEYTLLQDVEKEIITRSYEKALQQVGATRADNISLIQEKFEKAVEEYMIENKYDIQKKLPEMAEGFYEKIYIGVVKRYFNLARMTSDRVIEMNTFLNSNDLFNIVTKFMEPITKMQRMKEV